MTYLSRRAIWGPVEGRVIAAATRDLWGSIIRRVESNSIDDARAVSVEQVRVSS